MNELQIFESPEFGNLEIVMVDGKEYFKAYRVAKMLGYKRPNDAVSQHCRYTVKHRIATSQGNSTDMNLIPEPDLYRLITNSKLESAIKFERWLFEVVLPSIRKNGGYIHTKFGDTEEDIIERAKKILKATLEEKDSLIQQQALTIDKTKELIRRLKPFYEVTRVIRDREGLLTLEMVSKLLYDNDNRIGRNTFIGILRDMKLLNQNNLPYQKYINSGHFRVKFKRLSKTDEFYSVPVTLVTGKGVVYLTNRILKEFKNDK